MTVFLVLLGVADAQSTPEKGVYPDWELHPPGVHRPLAVRPDVQAALSARHPGLQRLRNETEGDFFVTWNEEIGTPHCIVAENLPVFAPPYFSSSSGLDDSKLDREFRAFLRSYPDLFPVDITGLHLDSIRDLGQFKVVRYGQRVAGVPVLGSGVGGVISSRGLLVRISFDALPSSLLSNFSTSPEIDADMATRALERIVGSLSRTPVTRPVIVPTWVSAASPFRTGMPASPLDSGAVLLPRLAWEIRTRASAGELAWAYYVTASRTTEHGLGTVLGRWRLTSSLDVEGKAIGLASPGWRPDVCDNSPGLSPIPGLKVLVGSESFVTDDNGEFSAPDLDDSEALDIIATLEGPFCVIENLAGETLTFDEPLLGGNEANVTFNLSSDETGTSQVNAFIGVNRAHDFVTKVLPDVPELDAPVLTRVNVDDDCNAFFRREGDGILEFFRSGGCANSAYSSIVFHEYGHFVSWKAFGDGPIMPAYDEGMADGLALLMTGTSEIGSDFNGPPEECDSRAPLRDLAKSKALYPNDVLSERHEAGLILGRAFWNLRENLIGAHGEPEADEILSTLHLKSLFLPQARAVLSPDLVLDFLNVDDLVFGDGNIFNGTPNDTSIVSAFTISGLEIPNVASVSHVPLDDGPGEGPYLVEALVFPRFSFVEIEDVLLHYSTDGGEFFQQERMTSSEVAALYHGEIPDSPEGTTLRYYIEARTDTGGTVFHPNRAIEEQGFFFTVGTPDPVYRASFDGDPLELEWTHGLSDNGKPGNQGNENDWELGEIRSALAEFGGFIPGVVADPPTAYSAPMHWGNDLNLTDSTDANYSNCAHSFLESPPIDCRGLFGIHLRFSRFLTIEHRDKARILVKSESSEWQTIYISPGHRDVFDRDWRLLDYDISQFADDRSAVQVRFELETNSFLVAGGWNIDEVSLISTGSLSETIPFVGSIAPSVSGLSGGPIFRIFGYNFTANTEIFFGNVPVTALALVSPVEMRGQIPAGEVSGPTAVVVRNAEGSFTFQGGFSYFGAPQVVSTRPASANLRGGVEISVTGQFFTKEDPEVNNAGTRLWIDGREILPLEVLNSEVVRGLLPPGDSPGAVEVRVATPFGDQTFPQNFTYTAVPEIEAITPSRSSIEGGEEFEILGKNFPSNAPSVTVFFDDTPVPVETIDHTRIRGTIPAGTVQGPVDIRVSTLGGQSLLEDAFEYFIETPKLFIRGDADLSGTSDFSDTLLILVHLFLGGGEIHCRDAADSNDDGGIDLTDAIFNLNVIFLGLFEFPAPYPQPGIDPTTNDILDCARGLPGI